MYVVYIMNERPRNLLIGDQSMERIIPRGVKRIVEINFAQPEELASFLKGKEALCCQTGSDKLADKYNWDLSKLPTF